MSNVMANRIAKILAKRALDDVKEKNLDINGKNPYEEEYHVIGKDGRPTNKVKKRKRPIPTNLSAHDADVLKKVRRRAYRLDMGLFRACGVSVGWSSVIAIIPVIGDFIDVFMALMVLHTCDEVEGGIPHALRMRMLFNIAIDFGIGLVPILGDVADALFRANTRNCWLLEVYLTKKAEANSHGTVTDPETGKTLPTRPEQAKLKSGITGLLGFGGRKNQDEEMAMGSVSNNNNNNNNKLSKQQRQP